MKSDQNVKMTDEEWENRTLCSDGECIGVIGPDGLCKECKKPYEGELKNPVPARADQDADADANKNDTQYDDADENDAFYDDTEEDDDQSEDKEIISDEEWENRTLCSDGECIGVIGPDGLCKECKKPYKI